MVMEDEKSHGLPPAHWTQEGQRCDPSLSSEQEKGIVLLA